MEPEKKKEGERPYWKVAASLFFSLLGTVLFLVIGIKALTYFMPFVIGWFIAFLAYPLAGWLERRLKIKKKLGSALIMIFAIGAVAGLGYWGVSKLVREIQMVISNAPDLYQDLEIGLREIGDKFQGIYRMLPEGVQTGWNSLVSNMDEEIGKLIGSIGNPAMQVTGNVVKRIPSILVAVIVTLVAAYFFIAQREEVIQWSKKIAPKAVQERMSMVIYNLKYAVGGYFKAQFKIMAVVGLILLAGFFILKVEYALLLAVLIAFLDFLPFFGTGTALIPWALYQIFTSDYREAIGLFILYGVTQLVRQIIQPKLVGDSVGLNPLVTLFLLYFGYKLGGLLGMILAVPIGMILINLYKAGAFDYILDDVKVLAKGIAKLQE
ncbi:sporulation integral membrane protein YtvI [Sellimonas caecigallum]|uniref:Sporulation integral membrane protein YtvI n=1 Tax=Sellimonas caecigallum TaxID=2592333 RepID=A0ABS7L5Q9_9FIRM|nr:sporulation integral membrane protein YtvI [Sellimonas caecigallum]MBY0758375.1 sporulation integral membrane protein YtvI [Sellimonas caecigallum]OUP65526.1 sporulation integral membrane protein YtvI [Drancourtella sp. An177]